jgi:hypothetical protein
VHLIGRQVITGTSRYDRPMQEKSRNAPTSAMNPVAAQPPEKLRQALELHGN